MAYEVLMPQLGLTMEEGTVSQWLKKEGDEVKAGEAILEITTDKLTNEVVSEHDGVLLKIVAQEGDDIPVKGLLAYIGQPGEQVGEQVGDGAAAPAAAAAPEAAPPPLPPLLPHPQQHLWLTHPASGSVSLPSHGSWPLAWVWIIPPSLVPAPLVVSWQRTSMPQQKPRRHHLLPQPQLPLPQQHLLQRPMWS